MLVEEGLTDRCKKRLLCLLEKNMKSTRAADRILIGKMIKKRKSKVLQVRVTRWKAKLL